MPPRVFQKPSLTDVAYQEIRKGILTGKLTPGHRLVVNDLVEEWKISNTPIKEALNRLVAEGMVEVEPRRGMRVRRRLSAKELRDMFEIRVLYETHCCRLVADNQDEQPALVAELGDIMEQVRRSLDDPSSHLFLYELDERFHKRIVSVCGNPELVKNFAHVHANIVTFGIFSSQQSPLYRQVETYEEHMLVLEALRRRSPEESAEAMREHLRKAAAGMLAFYRTSSGRLESPNPL